MTTVNTQTKSAIIRALGCEIRHNTYDRWEAARTELVDLLRDYSGKYRQTQTPAGDGVDYIPCMVDRYVVAEMAWDIADELAARGE